MYAKWLPLQTLASKEWRRILRTWVQTLLPPIITTSLYYLIFGHLIGDHIHVVSDRPYGQFIVPGLTALGLISSAYANTSSSFLSEKFQKSIEPLLSSPLTSSQLVLGYVSGGLARGVLVAIIITFVGHCFSCSPFYHPGLYAALIVLSSAFFSQCGLLNAIWARTFDQISIIPTFLLTPLTYLGGVFYPISALPTPWATLAQFNPIAWLVSGLRYAVLGDGSLSAPSLILGMLIGNALLFIWLRTLVKNRTHMRL